MQNKFAVDALVISYWQAFFAMYILYNFYFTYARVDFRKMLIDVETG